MCCRSRNSVATAKVGDGKIDIMPVEEAIRMRTSETGRNAI